MKAENIAETDSRRARRRSRHKPARQATRAYQVPLDRYPMSFNPSGYTPNRICLWRAAWLTALLLIFSAVMTALATTGNPSEAQFVDISIIQFLKDTVGAMIALIGAAALFAVLGTPLVLATWLIETSAERQMGRRKKSARG